MDWLLKIFLLSIRNFHSNLSVVLCKDTTKAASEVIGSNGYGQSNMTLAQELIAGFGKVQGCKQFMEKVFNQIFLLKEGSWTLSVASLRIGRILQIHLETTSHRICWA